MIVGATIRQSRRNWPQCEPNQKAACGKVLERVRKAAPSVGIIEAVESDQPGGLEDFEYLWLLEQRIRELKQRTGEEAFWLDPRQRPTELYRRVVQSFYEHTRDSKVLLDTRRAVADEIESLDTEPLLLVQS